MANQCSVGVCFHRKEDARWRCRVDTRSAALREAQAVNKLATDLLNETAPSEQEEAYLSGIIASSARLIRRLEAAKRRDVEDILGMG